MKITREKIESDLMDPLMAPSYRLSDGNFIFIAPDMDSDQFFVSVGRGVPEPGKTMSKLTKHTAVSFVIIALDEGFGTDQACAVLQDLEEPQAPLAGERNCNIFRPDISAKDADTLLLASGALANYEKHRDEILNVLRQGSSQNNELTEAVYRLQRLAEAVSDNLS